MSGISLSDRIRSDRCRCRPEGLVVGVIDVLLLAGWLLLAAALIVLVVRR